MARAPLADRPAARSRRALRCALAALALVVAAGAARADDVRVPILAYHDVRDDVGRADRDAYAISTANLVAHFEWLRAHGFEPIGIDELLAARAGRAALPPKPVLLTFDDGFASVYRRVFPLLKVFGYPAVVAVVTAWLDGEATAEHAGRTLGRGDFAGWAALREMQASGLVEIASHTHDLHRGVPGNPQGNLEPAAVTRRYAGGRYETDAEYRARIERDLARSAERIAAELGRRPRVLAWPYGAYSAEAAAIAGALGFEAQLGLGEPGRRRPAGTPLARHLVRDNPGVEALAAALLEPPPAPIVRAAQVDLDYVYDPDPAQQERNLDALVERIAALEISHVFLQAFADPDGDGGASALYFPNGVLPVRADLFDRVAWQLKTRANVRVFAWLPVLAFEGGPFDPAWRVLRVRDGRREANPNAEPRLSPFEPRARALIAEIYRDLAKHAHFDGLLFHDDARLDDHEDANPAALAAYRAAFGDGFALERAARDPALAAQFARFKTDALVALTGELEAVVRAYRPEIETARNLFAPALLDPGAERYLAQRFDAFTAAYDYVALMAMPRLEGAADPEAFYRALAGAVGREPDGFARTIFELQTVDWSRGGARLDSVALARTMRALQSLGVRHLAYYPEDFVAGHPELAALRAGISLAVHPRPGLAAAAARAAAAASASAPRRPIGAARLSREGAAR